MKKQYENPMINVEEFSDVDVFTASSVTHTFGQDILDQTTGLFDWFAN